MSFEEESRGMTTVDEMTAEEAWVEFLDSIGWSVGPPESNAKVIKFLMPMGVKSYEYTQNDFFEHRVILQFTEHGDFISLDMEHLIPDSRTSWR